MTEKAATLRVMKEIHDIRQQIQEETKEAHVLIQVFGRLFPTRMSMAYLLEIIHALFSDRIVDG